MADRLVSAIGKGTFKAAAQQATTASKAALDVVSFRNLYRAGLVGPLLQSIVSEYKKSEQRSASGKPQQVSTDGKVISANIAISLKNMSSQLSAIADVMDDIRELTKNQLQLDKDVFKKQQQQIRSTQAASMEEKLEAVRPSASGIFSGIQGQAEKQLGPVGKIASGVLGFAKENPIISAIIGAGLLASSGIIKDFVKEFREKSGIDKDIKDAISSIGTSIGEVIIGGFKSLEVKIKEYINSFLPSFMKMNTGEGEPSTGSGDTARKLGQAALGYGVGRIVAGRFGGIAGALYGGTEASFGESLIGGAGLLAGGALLKSRTGAAAEALKLKLGTGAAAASGISGTVPAAPTASSLIISDYSKGREEIGREARQLERQSSKASFSGIVKRLKKIGFKRAATLLASRAAIGLGGFAAGPIGIITTLLSVGYTLYTVSEMLDEIEKAIAEEANVETVSVEGPQPITPASSLVQPVENPTATIQSQADYENYRQRIMQLESGGRNIASATGGSAFGLYQITQSTFERMKKQDPSLKDITFDQMKSDPNIQNRVFDKLTAANADTLRKSGIDPTPFNLYLAHRLGAPAAINILKAKDKNAGLIDTAYAGQSFKFKSQVYNLNPDMQNKTVGQFIAERAAKFEGAAGTITPFTPTSATPDTAQMDKLGDIIGLSAFNKAAEMVRPIIIDQSTTGGGQSSRPTTPPSSPTIPATQQSKHELRFQMEPNTTWLMVP